jgi:hypothetical protein
VKKYQKKILEKIVKILSLILRKMLEKNQSKYTFKIPQKKSEKIIKITPLIL